MYIHKSQQNTHEKMESILSIKLFFFIIKPKQILQRFIIKDWRNDIDIKLGVQSSNIVKYIL